jgi:dipeptidyl aminopeptidase/acylaminoacyl peptidase
MTMPTFTPRSLIRAQAALEAFSLASDGASVIYALRRVDGDEYVSHLWARGTAARGAPRQLTRGRVRDGGPALSPDGRTLAFVRTPVGIDEATAQAWILPLDGGEPWQLTSLKHGVAGVKWSPDGRRLALLAQAGDHRFIVGNERLKRAPLARRITRVDFRDDETGHVVRRAHLWATAVRTGARPRQLTRGDYDVLHPAWSPDGTRIAFAADRGPDTILMPRLEILSVPAGGGAVVELASLAGDADRPAFSADGRLLAFVGTDVADPPDHVPPSLWVRDLSSGEARDVLAGLDRPVGEWAWNDLVMAEEAPGPVWLDDARLLVIVGSCGRNLPYVASLGGPPSPLVDESTQLNAVGIAAARGDRTIVISGALEGSAGDLFAVERGGLRAITRDGSSWLRRFPRVEIAELELPGPGGPIHAWLASPADAGSKRLPLILHIHGGPTGAWGPSGTIDEIALCAAGYRVLMPNIRGSATFGSGWIRAFTGRWGDVDAADALAAVDALVDRGLADPDRLGVMGLSYGGFLTQWLIGVTDRFAAAVAENGVANQVSTWANSYFGVHFNRRGGLADPLTDDGMHALWRSSPLRNAAAITTPLLILQSEDDRICPAADNEQLFVALKVLEREVELILYPEEHHEMKSHGRPDRRIDRLERSLDWFGRHF